MTPPASRRSSPMLRLLISSAAALVVMMSQPVSAVEPETCFSRQHQNAIVNVRMALNRASAAMDARVVRSERDCVLACCSEEVKPGAKCNMAVFNGNKHGGDDNCFLFHCQTDQDCPLTKALDGINTYDIYKGLNHPTIVRAATTTATSSSTSSTSSSTTTTPAPTTPTTPTTTRTTSAASLVIVPKGAVQSDHVLQNSSVGRGQAAAARGALKSGVVAFMVLGLAVLTLALAVGGRKAMESFDRRHYTRLELNDLHYEV
ncbi:MANSC domain-containing protein 1 [Stegastes partitus]|uniref:MANSC domain-containing protein 1 n=1 Tax=Stegastes partitus TaxID=144197 RepID=A0A9Y4N8V1_9TELE|nr:PREDICTED: MANSC domain-containing protein 1 [Stegastes partitus]